VKTNSEPLINVINSLIKKAFPFAVYQYPGSGEICIIAQSEPVHLVYNIDEICNLNGFLIAPFESVKTGLGYFIRNDLFACESKGFEDILNKIKKTVSVNKPNGFMPACEMTRDEYLEMAEFVIEKLKRKQLAKVVMSRVISLKREKSFSVSDFFLKLAEKYKGAFVYLFFIPDSGMWVGATPEILLSRKKNGDVVIMSLAGTAKIEKGKNIIWGSKEKEEQQYVSDYISHQLKKLGIEEFYEGPVKTVAAGHIAHLQTIFEVKAEQLEDKTGSLIKGLHPTPAVCGLPKTNAYKIIQAFEKHDRRFYTGYLGPWKLNGRSDLFVNLRCAEITSDNINLYVGGGFTADSIPEKEWEETELKAQTLIKVINKENKT